MKPALVSFFRKLSYPVGWLYGLCVCIRNYLFNSEILKSRTFKTAVISVGNITVGGTGKTPFVEFLIRILKDNYKVIELSRGYKRKTKGLQEAVIGCTAATIGDEPYQIFRKFPDVRVVACANRCQAIGELETRYSDTDVFILDDAFQHRYVNPGISILLIDYNRPIISDSILPYGDLRESAASRYRADIVVVTKCPASMNAFDAREIKNILDLHAYQNLYFSTLKYSTPRRMVDGAPLESLAGMEVLLITSIANPSPLKEFIGKNAGSLDQIIYEDHHNYTKKDIAYIQGRFDSIPNENKVIIITAKDEAKIVDMNISDALSQSIYVIDVEIDFLFGDGAEFSKKIIDYVEKNKRNSILFAK
ncbi:MAG: tetraacyldisaccharide 4'-kinase [Paludibacteraceae bacterium]|nr:tetraacyldisaccharide 4'-kinase [Paludibacteraceae bacterium]